MYSLQYIYSTETWKGWSLIKMIISEIFIKNLTNMHKKILQNICLLKYRLRLWYYTTIILSESTLKQRDGGLLRTITLKTRWYLLMYSLDPSWLFLLKDNWHVATCISLDERSFFASTSSTKLYKNLQRGASKFVARLAIIIIRRKMLLIPDFPEWPVLVKLA